MSGVLKWKLDVITEQTNERISAPVLFYLRAKEPGNYGSVMTLTPTGTYELAAEVAFYRRKRALLIATIPEKIATVEWMVKDPKQTEVTLETLIPKLLPEEKLQELLMTNEMVSQLQELYQYVKNIPQIIP